jgi:hypothetical protein
MTIQVIVGAVAVVCISVCGLIGTLTSFEMIDKREEKWKQAQKNKRAKKAS